MARQFWTFFNEISYTKMMPKKKQSLKQSSSTVNQVDLVFIGQLIVGVVLFFSIYSNALMGPFGRGLNFIGYHMFGDAFSLMPWVLIATSFALFRHQHRSLRRYFLILTSFLFMFLTGIGSIFLHQMIGHGEI